MRYSRQKCKEPSASTIDNFIEILALGRYYISSLPHDAVYGFLGLANDEIGGRITPDYHDSRLKVFVDAAVQIIVSAVTLLLFGVAGVRNKARVSPSRPS